jgi:hypothetical protein
MMQPPDASNLFTGSPSTAAGEPAGRVNDFMRRLIANAQQYDGPERRGEPRYNLVMSVPTQPLNDDFQASGQRFIGITRSISAGGVAFFYVKPVVERFLAMQFTDPSGSTITAILHVLRCEQRGSLYEIAGKFIGQL